MSITTIIKFIVHIIYHGHVGYIFWIILSFPIDYVLENLSPSSDGALSTYTINQSRLPFMLKISLNILFGGKKQAYSFSKCMFTCPAL